MGVAPYVHTLLRSRFAEVERRRVIEAVQRAAVGVRRLMPVILHGKITAWCGWSDIERQSVVIEHRPWMNAWIDRNGLLLGYINVDDLIKNITTNKQLRQLMWQKPQAASTVQGWIHLWNVKGYPGAGTFGGAARVAQRKNDTIFGSMPHGGDVSTATKHVLSGWFQADSQGVAGIDPCVVCLYDMVISYDNCATSNVLQSFDNTLTAQRYIGAGDPGLRIMGCWKTTAGNNTNFSDIRYTSITGSAPEHVSVPGVASIITPFDSSPSTDYASQSIIAMSNGTGIRSLLEAPLRAGDAGVKQLDDFTMSATNADTMTFILGFQLAWIAAPMGDYIWTVDFVKQASALPRVRDGACLTHALYAGGVDTQWMGGYTLGWA